MKITFPKQVLRLILGTLALALPIVLPIGQWLMKADQVLLPSISTYYYSEVRFLFLIILILFGATFILYGITTSGNNLWVLVATGILTLLIALVPTHPPGLVEWTGFFHMACAVIFFAFLGWTIRQTFNLPLPYPLLTKIGLYIWIAEGVLIIYFLTLKWIWPPLVFFIEGAILWLFVFGMWVRNKITKELSKAR